MTFRVLAPLAVVTALSVPVTRPASAATFYPTTVAAGGTLALRNVTAQNGAALTGTAGGAICNHGTLSIASGAFSSNQSGDVRGVIYNASTGTVASIVNSTFSGNTGWKGGAIGNDGAIATLANSTLVANTSTYTGGGIFNAGTITTLASCIVATNTAGDSPNMDIDNGGTITNPSYDLVGDGTGSGLTNGVNGNLVGASGSPINPQVGPLANNGGPTRARRR